MFDFLEKVEAENNKGFLPAWSRHECPVVIFDNNNLSIYQNDNEIGIMDSSGEVDSFDRAEAALFFGNSCETLYLRANFNEIYKIDYDEDKKQLFEQLFNARLAVFCKCSDSTLKTENGLPVIHDPNELKHFFDHGNISSSNPGKNVDAAEEEEYDDEEDDNDEDDGIESLTKEIWQRQVQDFQAMETAVDAALAAHRGVLVSRHRDFGKYGSNLDVAVVNGRCLLINYFDENGDWLPEEEAFGGDPPLYFSECDHCVSPVFVAKGFGDYFNERLKGDKVVTILIVSTGCELLDEENFIAIWRDDCHVEVVRTKRIVGSQLASLHEYFDSIISASKAPVAIDIEEVKAIDADFSCAEEV